MNLWCMKEQERDVWYKKQTKNATKTAQNEWNISRLGFGHLCEWCRAFWPIVCSLCCECCFIFVLCSFCNAFLHIDSTEMWLHAIILQLISLAINGRRKKIMRAYTLHKQRIDCNETFRYFKLPIVRFMRLLILQFT